MTIEVEYNCPTCRVDFCVYHSDETRNSLCSWCDNPVKLTGKISKIKGDSIVVYQDNEEVSRRKKPK
jgi:hypothetical protein